MNTYQVLAFLAACLRDDAGTESLGQRIRGVRCWETVAEVASTHAVSTALYPALRRRGLLEALPEDFREYLHGLWLLNTQRNERLIQQALEVQDLLHGIGIQAVFLKGVASLADGLYEDAGTRLIGDIDVLVPETAILDARAALMAVGYQRSCRAPVDLGVYDHIHQDAPLIHSGRCAAVELHRRPVQPQRGCSMFRRLESVQPVGVLLGEKECLILNPTQRLVQVFVHQMIQDGGFVYGIFNLRQLHEAHRIGRIHSSRIDWSAIRAASKDAGCWTEWAAFVVALTRLFAKQTALSMRECSRGELWFMRACAQSRWPKVNAFNRFAYHKLRRYAPHALKRGIGLADYGWHGE